MNAEGPGRSGGVRGVYAGARFGFPALCEAASPALRSALQRWRPPPVLAPCAGGEHPGVDAPHALDAALPASQPVNESVSGARVGTLSGVWLLCRSITKEGLLTSTPFSKVDGPSSEDVQSWEESRLAPRRFPGAARVVSETGPSRLRACAGGAAAGRGRPSRPQGRRASRRGRAPCRIKESETAALQESSRSPPYSILQERSRTRVRLPTRTTRAGALRTKPPSFCASAMKTPQSREGAQG